MNTEEATVGSVKASSAERQALAARSMEYNMKDPTFIAVFGAQPLIHFERIDAILQAKADMRLKSLAKRNKIDGTREEAHETNADLKADTASEDTSILTCDTSASTEHADSKKVGEVFSLDIDSLKL